METMRRPQIAIICPNTLTCIGLRNILEKMMPGAEACLFGEVGQLLAVDQGQFFHYFVSSKALLTNANYFLEHRHKTIVLIHGNETGHLPQQFHTLNICQSEEMLVKSVLKLAEGAHNARHPQVVEEAKCPAQTASNLTKRETEVLQLVVSGMINKEIANQLNVTLATVISHRKNINAKLKIKSISGLTIYAVMHGYVRAEEI